MSSYFFPPLLDPAAAAASVNLPCCDDDDSRVPFPPLYFLFRGGGLRPSLLCFFPSAPSRSATPWCIFNLRAVVSRRTQKAPFPPPFPPIRGVTP